jgi:hypothetical protein
MTLLLLIVALYLFCQGLFWCGLAVLLAAFLWEDK